MIKDYLKRRKKRKQDKKVDRLYFEISRQIGELNIGDTFKYDLGDKMEKGVVTGVHLNLPLYRHGFDCWKYMHIQCETSFGRNLNSALIKWFSEPTRMLLTEKHKTPKTKSLGSRLRDREGYEYENLDYICNIEFTLE